MDYMDIINKLFAAIAEFIIAVAPELAEKLALIKKDENADE